MSTSTTTREYNCIPCNFSTTTKSRYQQHLKTKKHAKLNIEEESSSTINIPEEFYAILNHLSLIHKTDMINKFKEMTKPLLQDIRLFTISIHLEKDKDTFDRSLKAICATCILSEDQIHTIQLLANKIVQKYNIATLKDIEGFNTFKTDLKDSIIDEETINELITFVYE